MLLPYTTLVYYGPGAAAAVAPSGLGTAELPLKGTASIETTAEGSGAAVLLKATRLVNSPMFVEGSGALVAATPKGRARPTLTVNIGAVPSAFDIAQAVLNATATQYNIAGTIGQKINDSGSASNPWNEVIESGYTAAEILRMVAAVTHGDATGLESGSPVFKGLDGTTDRVTATYSNGTRTVTGRDGS